MSFAPTIASAQMTADLDLGLVAAFDKMNCAGIDNASPANAFGSFLTGSVDARAATGLRNGRNTKKPPFGHARRLC